MNSKKCIHLNRIFVKLVVLESHKFFEEYCATFIYLFVYDLIAVPVNVYSMPFQQLPILMISVHKTSMKAVNYSLNLLLWREVKTLGSTSCRCSRMEECEGNSIFGTSSKLTTNHIKVHNFGNENA